jgi:hypothetical protein
MVYRSPPSGRVAIEQDALQQALLLQNNLKGLVQTVTALKRGVSETAAIARRIDEVIHSKVVSSSVEGSVSVENFRVDLADSSSGLSTIGRDTSDAALEQEQKLAAVRTNVGDRSNPYKKSGTNFQQSSCRKRLVWGRRNWRAHSVDYKKSYLSLIFFPHILFGLNQVKRDVDSRALYSSYIDLQQHRPWSCQ